MCYKLFVMDGLAYQFALVGLAFFLVFLNGFFVASEFSIVKVRATRIEQLSRQGQGSAKWARRMITQMDEYLSATQLGITLSSLGLGWVGEPAFAEFFSLFFGGIGDWQPVVTHSLSLTSAFLLITFLHIVLGELAPKSLAIQRPERTVLMVARPMIWFYRVSYPFIWSLNGTANWLLRAVGIGAISEHEAAHSEEELRMLLVLSHEKGILDRDERRMLERVFDFADRSVRQVMVPSTDVVFLDAQKSFLQNIEIAYRHGHTRYPLCEGSLDKPIGIIHVKDILWNMGRGRDEIDLMSIKRPIHFVPESKLIKSLLADFRSTRTHLAIVVDEYGSSIGIVTLENVLEEIVGEILDEFDVDIPPPMIRKTGEATWGIHGRTLLEDVEKALDVRLHDEENDTIAGHVMTLLGRPARIGDEVLLANRFRLRVVGMKGLQITDLIVKKIEM